MRAALLSLLTIAAAMSGCLSDGDPTADSDADGNPADAESSTVDPYHVDETFDLQPAGMDESWSWTMSPDMTGRVTIEYIPDPVATKSSSLCYELKWPTGRHSSCASGGLVVSVDGDSMTAPETVYDVRLNPDSFDLHVWTGSGADTAKAHVYIETWVVDDE